MNNKLTPEKREGILVDIKKIVSSVEEEVKFLLKLGGQAGVNEADAVKNGLLDIKKYAERVSNDVIKLQLNGIDRKGE